MNDVENRFDGDKYTEDVPETGTIEFNPPGYDSEQGGGTHMPDHLQCDACRVIGKYFVYI